MPVSRQPAPARRPAHRRSRAGALTAAVAALTALLAPAPATAAPTTDERAPGYDQARCGNRSGRVLLSLDDWSYDDPERAVRVGEYLRGKGIRAAFFLIGQYAAQQPRIAEDLRKQGHWVGNHSYSHPHLPRLSESRARQEIHDGVHSSLLRPPYGDFGPREERLAAGLGQRICTWTVDTLDWQTSGGVFRSPEALRASVREAPASAKTGGVILGHLFTRFPDALPGIVADLRDQGYRFCRNTGPTTPAIADPLPC
ncbi:polysaccharide deacetylase family protein [Streptomyces gamaensis]|uniref:Polysaccharide deacetylase family protein n=1 Tax=Streptomyces gamaensis TaxID=1763542 RepID=A0ABW0Z570_9ACTN